MFVKGFDIVDVEFPYQLTPSPIRYGKREVRYPTDIDVVGINLKHDEIWLVECKEELAKKDAEKLKEKFERHDRDSRFFRKEIKRYKKIKAIATCNVKNGFPQGMFRKKKFQILRAEEMIEDIRMEVENLRNRKRSRLTYGRYAWLLKWMDNYKRQKQHHGR